MVVCVWSWLIFVVLFFEFQGPMLLFHSPFLSSSVIFRGIVFCITGGEGDFNETQKQRRGRKRLRRFQRRREESGQGNSGTLGYGLGQKAD